jgi:DNA-binding CsgD family transcriptional regulator
MHAMQELADAETARGRHDPDEVSRWRRTADACRDAEVPWDEAYCRWREAQAALRERSTRRQGTAALRRAYELAVDLEARPLLADLDVLARNAHIPATIVAGPVAPADDFPGLTAREREILAHVVAGRTYREIARALVLSEKTVGVHISNMLRKTGTASRIELAQLAHRHTATPDDRHG